jgi:hydrogenase expression/formation protein HypE
MLAIVPAAAAGETLAILRADPLAREAAIVGEVTRAHPGTVELRGRLGGGRIVDLLSGEQMPRIC